MGFVGPRATDPLTIGEKTDLAEVSPCVKRPQFAECLLRQRILAFADGCVVVISSISLTNASGHGLHCYVSLCISRLHLTNLHSPDWLELNGLWGFLELLTEWKIANRQAKGECALFLSVSNYKTQPPAPCLAIFFKEHWKILTSTLVRVWGQSESA